MLFLKIQLFLRKLLACKLKLDFCCHYQMMMTFKNPHVNPPIPVIPVVYAIFPAPIVLIFVIYAILSNNCILTSRIRVRNTASTNGSAFEGGDKSENPADILINSYKGAIEFLFEIGTWLTYLDAEADSTRSIIESVVMESILQNYDRSKALKCLTETNVSVSFFQFQLPHTRISL